MVNKVRGEIVIHIVAAIITLTKGRHILLTRNTLGKMRHRNQMKYSISRFSQCTRVKNKESQVCGKDNIHRVNELKIAAGND
jgi:hypothetical protein